MYTFAIIGHNRNGWWKVFGCRWLLGVGSRVSGSCDWLCRSEGGVRDSFRSSGGDRVGGRRANLCSYPIQLVVKSTGTNSNTSEKPYQKCLRLIMSEVGVHIKWYMYQSMLFIALKSIFFEVWQVHIRVQSEEWIFLEKNQLSTIYSIYVSI